MKTVKIPCWIHRDMAFGREANIKGYCVFNYSFSQHHEPTLTYVNASGYSASGTGIKISV